MSASPKYEVNRDLARTASVSSSCASFSTVTSPGSRTSPSTCHQRKAVTLASRPVEVGADSEWSPPHSVSLLAQLGAAGGGGGLGEVVEAEAHERGRRLVPRGEECAHLPY